MATTSNNRKNWKEIYDGFDTKAVGAGTLDPRIYSNNRYARKKTQKLIIGGMNLITYAGWDHDASPLILTLHYIPAYNVILAYNLHYVPERTRHAMIQFIIKTNIRRIKKGQPIVIDYHQMKRAIPQSAKIVRMYKVPLIRVVETVPLIGWGSAIRGNSRWADHYKKTSTAKNESALKKFLRSVTNFFK
jgi:hypothetical protein